MHYKRLYVFVEGNDDERFFKKILKPFFKTKYSDVNIFKYAEVKKEKIVNFIKSINSMSGEYILLNDINSSVCISAKKQQIQNEISNLKFDSITVVIKEIESWILAGLDTQSSKRLKIKNFRNTDSINKEQFYNLMKNKYDSRIDFMIDILNYYSIDIAKTKNKSFRYFCEKYL
jgi:nitrogen regulatory protein PII-like uncharacterized protein